MALCAHARTVCLCTWKFCHLICVLISVVPDLRAGLMGTCSSNVGLLIIASQNNLPKKLPPFLQRLELRPQRRARRVHVHVSERVKTCWQLQRPVQRRRRRRRRHKHSSRIPVMRVYIKSFIMQARRHMGAGEKKKEKIRKKLDFRLRGSHRKSRFWVTHWENHTTAVSTVSVSVHEFGAERHQCSSINSAGNEV